MHIILRNGHKLGVATVDVPPSRSKLRTDIFVGATAGGVDPSDTNSISFSQPPARTRTQALHSTHDLVT